MQRDQAHRTNELLERIAIALEKNNKVSNELVDATTKDIPGFEGVLNDLDNLYQPDLSVYGNKDDDNDLNEARKFANLLAIEDEYETEILITTSKSEGWEMPVSLEQIREETSYQDMNVVNASWTVMRQESYMNGSWFRINIQIPIVDLIYLHESVIVRRIELGDYDNATD